MEQLVQNLKIAFRRLREQPGFTGLAIVVLALGIGANSAMFSLVNTMLFKPLQVEKPEELVGCYSRSVERPDQYRAFSYGEFAALREHNGVFRELAAHTLTMVGIQEGEATRRAFADVVSANWFDTFGVRPFLGRGFSAAEERPGGALPVAMVSHSYWQRLGSDPALLGKTLRVNGRDFTVVGVAARGFSGTTAMISPEVYLPLGAYDWVADSLEGGRLPLADPRSRQLILVGRLQGGLEPAAVDARLAASAGIQGEVAKSERQTYVARPLSRASISTSPQTDDELATPSVLLLFLSAIVLLIASLNIANMMLVRGHARRREIAIRLALGAKRGTILGQLFTEGLLLALAGGAAGLVIAALGTRTLASSLAALAPVDLVVPALPDVRVLAATGAFCLLSTVLFALAPAWNLSRPNVVAEIKSSPQDGEAGGGKRRLLSRRNLLVVGQLGLSLVLLSTAGLFLRSSLRAASADPGFRIDDSVVVEVDPGLAGYDDARGKALLATALTRLRAMPGVRSASVAATVPFGMVSLGRDIQPAEKPVGNGDGKSAGAVPAQYNAVADGYFDTLGVELLRGRDFTAADLGAAQPAVAIIDRVAAEKMWPGGDAVGRTLRILSSDEERRPTLLVQVVGVAGNVQEHLLGGDELTPHVYLPFGPAYVSDASFHVRSAGGGAEAVSRLVAAARAELQALDAQLPILQARSLRQHLDSSFDIWIMRIAARMFSLFALVAVLLAAVGLYGVRAFSVARRQREIGVRMALGASTAEAVRMILREGLRLTAVGAATGLVLSLALGRVLAGMLYRVSGSDPLVFGGAIALLGAVSLLACWVPARRAAQVAPMASLRTE